MGAESRMAIARGRRDGGWGEAGHTVSATKTSEFRRSAADLKFAESADEHSHGWGW